MSKESLKGKTVNGLVWSGIDNVMQFGITFIVSIILARMLSPDDYGLIGIVTIFTAICSTLTNAGFTNALIRKTNVTDDDYCTVFLVNLSISIFLYCIIFSIAPFIAVFFHREELIDLTRVSSLGIIVGAFSLVQQTRLTKRIDFKTQTKITLVSVILSGLIGICLAVVNCGVWALVFQHLFYQIFRTILLWVFNKWIPHLKFSIDSFRELFGFGWKIMLSSLLNTIWNELYQVVVGKFYNPYTLGQYTRAKQFSTLFSNNLNTVIQRVTFPVLSNIQEDRGRLVSAYRRIIKITMFVTAISMISLGAVSEPLIHCLIGQKWHEAAEYLPFICISASLYPLHSINLNMLQVQGRSDLFLFLEIIKKIIALCPLLIGAFIGILPMLYTNILAGIVAFFLNSYYSGKFLGYSSLKQFADIAPSYAIAFIIGFSVFFIKYLSINCWLILLIQIAVGVSVFYLLSKILQIEEYAEIKNIVMSYVNKFKR